jgi:hypothetical protein
MHIMKNFYEEEEASMIDNIKAHKDTFINAAAVSVIFASLMGTAVCLVRALRTVLEG